VMIYARLKLQQTGVIVTDVIAYSEKAFFAPDVEVEVHPFNHLTITPTLNPWSKNVYSDTLISNVVLISPTGGYRTA